MTFSISARCERTGMFGISVSSSSPAVAARCAYARAGIGAAATQNITDPTLGPRGLELMSLGASAEQAMATLVASTRHIEFRQLALVDRDGGTASHSGAHTLGRHAVAQDVNVVAAGNILANVDVPAAMVNAFKASAEEHLGDRLLKAMRAAVDAGGEDGPVHSAGLMLAAKVPWPVADLRVDWLDDDPIGELERVWEIYKPQLDNYVTRALDPDSAPSYGVAGDK